MSLWSSHDSNFEGTSCLTSFKSVYNKLFLSTLLGKCLYSTLSTSFKYFMHCSDGYLRFETTSYFLISTTEIQCITCSHTRRIHHIVAGIYWWLLHTCTWRPPHEQMFLCRCLDRIFSRGPTFFRSASWILLRAVVLASSLFFVCLEE